MGCNESKDMVVSSGRPQNTSNPHRNGAKPAAARSSAPKASPQSTSQQSSESCPAAKGPIKFSHFGDGGRCEPLLMLFAYGGIQYENDLVSIDNWPVVKPKTSSGTLPIMKIGEEELVSSLAMARYLGGEADLLGSSSEEQAACDTMMYTIEDCRGGDLFYSRHLVKAGYMDETARQAKEKEYLEGPVAKLCKYLESNVTGSKWLLSKLTIADFWLYGTLKSAAGFIPDIWSKMGPKVQAWRQHFESIPQVAEYLKREKEPKMTLMYFEDVRGRCEPYRMMLSYAGVNYDDDKIPIDSWPTKKPTTMMGFLPELKVGEEKLTTSLAILGYIGKETGLRGGCDEASCDVMVYTIEDCRSAVFPSRFLLRTGKMDDETKATKAKEFEEKALANLCKFLEEHITGDKWLLEQLSMADFWLYGTLEIIEDSLVPDVWSKMGPKVQKWRENFEAIPGVKAYLDSRPKEYAL